MSAACFSSSGQGAEPAACPQVFWLLGAPPESSFWAQSFSPLQFCHLLSNPAGDPWPGCCQRGKQFREAEINSLFFPSATNLSEHCDFSSPSGSSQMLPHLTAGYEWWAAKNRGLLVLWWIEFDAGIMAINVPGNVAFHFCGFWEHRDDHLLLADWKPQLRGPQKHFSPGYFLSNSLPWYL